MQPLSVVVITLNEGNNIRSCLLSVKNLADEIIVLDSGSTDSTLQIADILGARIEKHPFDGHIQQKNRAKNLAKNEWVLSLDADERLSPQLVDSIKKALENPVADGYYMNRLNHYCGKPIKTCGWYPDKKLRLWKKSAGHWQGTNPHDRFELDHGSAQFLNGDILHFTYATHNDLINQSMKFARIAASEFSKKSIFYLLFKLAFSPLFKFIKSYFLNLGCLSGKAGWEISTWQTREVFMKYALAIKNKYATTETAIQS